MCAFHVHNSKCSKVANYVQGLAFLQRYEMLRGSCQACSMSKFYDSFYANCLLKVQETYYNMARAMHQMTLYPQATLYYRRVLDLALPTVLMPESRVESPLRSTYDLRPSAAFNLALIYKHANNIAKAREILENHCVV